MKDEEYIFYQDVREKKQEGLSPCRMDCGGGINMIHIQIPVGYVGDVKSKSGLMMDYNITTDGTVDAGYTGSIRVKLFNHGLMDVHIQKGQKIAQLVIKKIITPVPVLVDSLEETERGDKGFGSSGKF